jgi:hypothetical protein
MTEDHVSRLSAHRKKKTKTTTNTRRAVKAFPVLGAGIYRENRNEVI